MWWIGICFEVEVMEVDGGLEEIWQLDFEKGILSPLLSCLG